MSDNIAKFKYFHSMQWDVYFGTTSINSNSHNYNYCGLAFMNGRGVTKYNKPANLLLRIWTGSALKVNFSFLSGSSGIELMFHEKFVFEVS